MSSSGKSRTAVVACLKGGLKAMSCPNYCSYGVIYDRDSDGRYYSVPCQCGGFPDCDDLEPYEAAPWEPEFDAPPDGLAEPDDDPLFPGSKGGMR